jgi:hypothetical protein
MRWSPLSATRTTGTASAFRRARALADGRPPDACLCDACLCDACLCDACLCDACLCDACLCDACPAACATVKTDACIAIRP